MKVVRLIKLVFFCGPIGRNSMWPKNICLAIYSNFHINPLRPDSDPSQTSHCNIKGLTVSEVMRIENMITQVKFY